MPNAQLCMANINSSDEHRAHSSIKDISDSISTENKILLLDEYNKNLGLMFFPELDEVKKSLSFKYSEIGKKFKISLK